MKRTILILTVMLILFSGCVKNPNANPLLYDEELHAVEKVGDVPAEFEDIIKNNVFSGVSAGPDRLLKSRKTDRDEESHTVKYRVEMLDLYGAELASYETDARDVHDVQTFTFCSDGGFLFVLGFSDRQYSYDPSVWASDGGMTSYVVRCDKNGGLVWQTALEVEGLALGSCFEKDGKYYFFGTREKPETKRRGVGSITDIYAAMLDPGDGSVIKSRMIGGSDFDWLGYVKENEDGFALYINAQSNDGDFENKKGNRYADHWEVELDTGLNITKKRMTSDDYYSYYGKDIIGFLDGKTVYRDDPLFEDFDAGRPFALIDYGEFYMIVSTNPTGVYEHTPAGVSSIWCYYETVYSGYNKKGGLIFRSSVGSSPDYIGWETDTGNDE